MPGLSEEGCVTGASRGKWSLRCPGTAQLAWKPWWVRTGPSVGVQHPLLVSFQWEVRGAAPPSGQSCLAFLGVHGIGISDPPLCGADEAVVSRS